MLEPLVAEGVELVDGDAVRRQPAQLLHRRVARPRQAVRLREPGALRHVDGAGQARCAAAYAVAAVLRHREVRARAVLGRAGNVRALRVHAVNHVHRARLERLHGRGKREVTLGFRV